MKERERPQQPEPAPARDDVRVAQSRCPFCHDAVDPSASTVCQGCLARHHTACWGESGACASCGGEAALEGAPPRVSGVTALCLCLATLGAAISMLTSLARGAQPSTLQAVCLGVLFMCALFTGARYRQQQRA